MYKANIKLNKFQIPYKEYSKRKKQKKHNVFKYRDTLNDSVMRFRSTYKRNSYSENMSLLLELSYIKLYNPVPYANLRKKSFFIPECAICWCCNDRPAEVQHHLIQLKNGGNNNKMNRVPLCKACHAEVHPWMYYEIPVHDESIQHFNTLRIERILA